MLGLLKRNAGGQIDSLRIEWQQTYMPRMKPGVLLPTELLLVGRYAEAIAGFEAMHLSESDIT